MTDLGTDAAFRLEESETLMPATGAGPLSVTTPADDMPPSTVGGFSTSETSVGGVTVSVADDLAPFSTAVTGTLVEAATGLADAENVIVLDPAATVTEAGPFHTDDEDSSDTGRPPTGAMELSVTVPVVVLPPTMEAGANDSALRTGAFTLISA